MPKQKTYPTEKKAWFWVEDRGNHTWELFENRESLVLAITWRPTLPFLHDKREILEWLAMCEGDVYDLSSWYGEYVTRTVNGVSLTEYVRYRERVLHFPRRYFVYDADFRRIDIREWPEFCGEPYDIQALKKQEEKEKKRREKERLRHQNQTLSRQAIGHYRNTRLYHLLKLLADPDYGPYIRKRTVPCYALWEDPAYALAEKSWKYQSKRRHQWRPKEEPLEAPSFESEPLVLMGEVEKRVSKKRRKRN